MDLRKAIDVIDNDLKKHGILPEFDWVLLKERIEEVIRIAKKILEDEK
jgi:hypothetical protein